MCIFIQVLSVLLDIYLGIEFVDHENLYLAQKISIVIMLACVCTSNERAFQLLRTRFNTYCH